MENNHSLEIGDIVEFVPGINDAPKGSCLVDWANNYCLEDEEYEVIAVTIFDVRIKGRLSDMYSRGNPADEIWVTAVQMKKINL